MNSPEYMMGTNRVVFKLGDNSKIIVTRDLVNDKIMYMVNVTSDISYAISDLGKECGYIIIPHGVNFDDYITIEGTLIENMALKEEYHIVNGNEFGKFTESYVPFPEETSRVSQITLCFDEVKEMTGDLDMIQDMVDDNILSISWDNLTKYDITIKPKLDVIKGIKNNSSKDNDTLKNLPSLLTLMNNRGKVLKKK